MARTLMDETCEATTWVDDENKPREWGHNPRLKRCGGLAVIESLKPVPAFLCLDCAVKIHSKQGLTWRRLPRCRKWRTDSPLNGTHL